MAARPFGVCDLPVNMADADGRTMDTSRDYVVYFSNAELPQVAWVKGAARRNSR
jgi:hypothetical protein